MGSFSEKTAWRETDFSPKLCVEITNDWSCTLKKQFFYQSYCKSNFTYTIILPHNNNNNNNNNNNTIFFEKCT